MRGARVRLELLQFACLIVSQLGSISTLCLIPTVHSFSSLRVQRNTHGVLANPDLSQAMAPSKKKRTHAVFCISSAHRLASTSKPRFGGEKVRLGDCFPYIKNGYNVRQGKDKGGMPITRIETLSDNRFNRDKVGYADIFSTEGLENHILEDGDILMPHINSLPYLGRSVMYRARPGEVFIHGMNLLRLKADRSVVEPGYAELYFRSPRFKQHVLKIAKKAVNQASFSVSDLKEIEFPLMSLCDQHDVIEKLSSVTTQIEHCQRAIGKLDSLVKSRFVEMFGELDTNPKGFQLTCFDDLGTWTSGGTPSRKNPSYFTGEIDWYSAGELNSLHLGRSKERISLRAIEESSAKLVPPGSLFVGMYDTAALKMGITTKESSSNQACANLVPNGIVDLVWLYFAIDQLKPSLLAKRSGCRQKNLSLKKIKSFMVPLPDLDSQQGFSRFVAQVDKSRFVRDHEMNFR